MKLTRRTLCRLSPVVPSLCLANHLPVPAVGAIQDTQSDLHHLEANERLVRMLRHIPASLGRQVLSEPGGALNWFDVEERMDALGFSFPESFEVSGDRSAYLEATRPLHIDNMLSVNALGGDLERLLGFGLLDVRQSISFIGPDGMVRLVAGVIDEQSVTQALLGQGYSEIDEGGHSLMSLSAESDFEMSSDIGRLGLGSLNNAAWTSDGVLAFAGRRQTLIAMLDSATGSIPSLADDAEIQQLLDHAMEPLSSAMILSSKSLFGEIADDEIVPDDDSLALTGFVSGSLVPVSDEPDQVPGSTMVLIINTPDQSQSMDLAKQVLLTLEGNRISLQGLDASDLFAGWDVRLVPNGDGVRIALRLKRWEILWSDLVVRREIGMLFGTGLLFGD